MELPKQVLVEAANGRTYRVSLSKSECIVAMSEDKDSSDAEGLPDLTTSACAGSSILQSWAPTREEKMYYKNRGETWKQGVWSQEETDRLSQNISTYCEDHNVDNPSKIIFESGKEKRKDFYRTVAKGINRPLFAVYRRIVRMYDAKNHIGKYSPEELQKLRDLRKQYGNDWQRIGLAMGRSAASIKDRCRHLKEDCNAGAWTGEEEDNLSQAVYSLTQALPGDNAVAGIPWIQVAQRVGTRSERQCRKKWLSYFTMKRVNRDQWLKEDEQYLVDRLIECGANDESEVDWASLARSWPRPTVRSHQWLRAKWRTLKSLVHENDLTFKEICLHIANEVGSSYATLTEPSPVNLETTTSPMLSVIGIVPATTTTYSLAPVLFSSPGYGNMYLAGCPLLTNMTGLPSANISFVTNLAPEGLISDNVTVVHLDLDGGDESAVTTDVMLSGGSICGRVSPLELGGKGDDESQNSHSSK